MHLREFGIWTSYRAIGEENAGEAAALVEELGFGAFWLGGAPASGNRWTSPRRCARCSPPPSA